MLRSTEATNHLKQPQNLIKSTQSLIVSFFRLVLVHISFLSHFFVLSLQVKSSHYQSFITKHVIACSTEYDEVFKIMVSIQRITIFAGSHFSFGRQNRFLGLAFF